jgi:hypothetical protein
MQLFKSVLFLGTDATAINRGSRGTMSVDMPAYQDISARPPAFSILHLLLGSIIPLASCDMRL